MWSLKQIDPTVVIVMFACCAFLTLHLVWGGATILLCIATATMAIVLITAYLQRRTRTLTVIRGNKQMNVFHSVADVDDSPFWKNSLCTPNAPLDGACPICLSDFVDSQPMFSRCCDNAFHQTCVKTYFFHNQNRHVSCPICREHVFLESAYRMSFHV